MLERATLALRRADCRRDEASPNVPNQLNLFES